MTHINPYLLFENNCREAMTFYRDCVGGDLTMQTVAESAVAGQKSPDAAEKIMHASLTKKGMPMLMASDMLEPGAHAVQGNTISLSLNCSSEDEIQTIFAKLSEGGKVTQPLKDEFWGATFGMLTDKFGMHWMLNYNKK